MNRLEPYRDFKACWEDSAAEFECRRANSTGMRLDGDGGESFGERRNCDKVYRRDSSFVKKIACVV